MLLPPAQASQASAVRNALRSASLNANANIANNNSSGGGGASSDRIAAAMRAASGTDRVRELSRKLLADRKAAADSSHTQ